MIRTIELLTDKNIDYDGIYNNTNIHIKYLNNLSIDEIFKKLKKKIIYNRAFEIINYLYTQIDLSFNENIKLIKIINEKYHYKDLNLLKNKISEHAAKRVSRFAR